MDKPRSVVAIRHLCFEDLGLFQALLIGAGYAIKYCDAPIDDINTPENRNCDLLIVLGGPISAYDTRQFPFLLNEIKIIEYRIKQNLPTLGICLGAQLMTLALGAKVYPGPIKEIGWSEINLTKDGYLSFLRPLAKPDATVLHWHGDTFDLPRNAIHLASSKIYHNQVYSYGSKCLALQFHLEVDPEHIESWLVGNSHELASINLSPEMLRFQANKIGKYYKNQAAEIFMGWLKSLNDDDRDF